MGELYSPKCCIYSLEQSVSCTNVQFSYYFCGSRLVPPYSFILRWCSPVLFMGRRETISYFVLVGFVHYFIFAVLSYLFHFIISCFYLVHLHGTRPTEIIIIYCQFIFFPGEISLSLGPNKR